MRESSSYAVQNWPVIYALTPIGMLSVLCAAFTGKESLYTCSCYNNKASFLSLCWQKQAECALGSKALYL